MPRLLEPSGFSIESTFIYYPILGIAVATGLYLATITGLQHGLWLHYKLVGLLLLIVFDS